MDRKIINPWTWQDKFQYVQANQISGPAQVLYCAGQTSVDENGNPVHLDDMAARSLRRSTTGDGAARSRIRAR
jgi:hypothetical protein